MMTDPADEYEGVSEYVEMQGVTGALEAEFDPPSLEELAQLFPQYSMEGFIAQGGMGAVYLAKQTALDRYLALKVLPRQISADPSFRASFESEAKAMARLNHPNLVGIYDFGDADGMLYIAMEYVPGQSLHEVAYEQQYEVKVAAKLVCDICAGLGHAHQHDIMHRDVKPANILLSEEGEPKLADFGLAQPSGVNEVGDDIFGTPGYTAPEVLEVDVKVDQRADIYSVGAIFYQLITGQTPPDPYVPPSRFVDCGEKVDRIIRRALHPSPALRYQTAEELADDLRPFHQPAGSSSSARRKALVTAPATPSKPQAKRLASAGGFGIPAWAALILLILLACIGGVIWVNKQGRWPEMQNHLVRQQWPAAWTTLVECVTGTPPSAPAEAKASQQSTTIQPSTERPGSPAAQPSEQGSVNPFGVSADGE